MKIKHYLLPLTFIVITIAGMTSCRKKGYTLANIYVRDESNAVVEGAMVVLYGTNTQNPPTSPVAVRDTSFTNAAGLASFNYNDIYQLGQAGVAVLDIQAQLLNKIGQGIIKIEPEQVNEETVFIQP
jgi:hypothetical protein